MWGGGWFYPPLCRFSLNSSEMVKAVILVFCSTQQHFIRNICAKFATTNPSQSLDLGQYSDGDIFDFWIFGQSFINENCHNSRTSHDIDMKLGLVTKLDKRNEARSKNLTITSCQKIVTSLSFFRLIANLQTSGSQIPEACPINHTFHYFINNNLLSYKNWKQN